MGKLNTQRRKKDENKQGQLNRHRNSKVSSHSIFTDYKTSEKNKGKLSKAQEKKVKKAIGYAKELIEQLAIDNMTMESYIPATQDLPALVEVKVVDLLRSFNGRGLYAKADIPEGTVLGIYTGEEYTTEEDFLAYLAENEGRDRSYAMTIGTRVVDAQEKGNFTRYINFSDSQANVAFIEGRDGRTKVVQVIAIKNISQGQQILVDYNCYEQRASTDFFFLNPEDSWLSAQKQFEANRQSYSFLRLDTNQEAFKLKKGEYICITAIGQCIANNQQLSQTNINNAVNEINLPFQKVARNGVTICDFNEADSFTAIMLASYLGQADNVEWLINHGANIDQQQNQSGNGALFFALEGYRDDANLRQDCLKILCLLISYRANIHIHDRADRSFIHKASLILAPEDLEILVNHIKEQDHINAQEIFSFVDHNNHDPILACLAQKDFVKARLLLSCYPNYFKVAYVYNRDKNLDFFNKLSLTDIVAKSYNDSDKKQLLQLLIDFDISPNSKLMGQLGLNIHDNASRQLSFL